MIKRTPLLFEMDDELRRRERAHLQDPADAIARKAYIDTWQRTGLPAPRAMRQMWKDQASARAAEEAARRAEEKAQEAARLKASRSERKEQKAARKAAARLKAGLK